MKAVVLTKYGSVDGLQLKEIEKPTPKDDQILIRVVAFLIVFFSSTIIFPPLSFPAIVALYLHFRNRHICGLQLQADYCLLQV